MKLASTQYTLKYKSFEIYVSGCREHPCSGCHAVELWDETVGKEFNESLYNSIRHKIVTNIDMIDNLFILGGEPLEKPKEEVLELIKFLQQFGKPIWLFTRFEKDNVNPEILKELDYIKTGMYLKNSTSIIEEGIELASSNQKVIKLK